MQNVKWVNRLNLRLTYGINGNVSKETGPYLMLEDANYNSWTGDFSNSITMSTQSRNYVGKNGRYKYWCGFLVLNSS